jgi:hypothetical protein
MREDSGVNGGVSGWGRRESDRERRDEKKN